jgi:hypothetical protein
MGIGLCMHSQRLAAHTQPFVVRPLLTLTAVHVVNVSCDYARVRPCFKYCAAISAAAEVVPLELRNDTVYYVEQRLQLSWSAM